MLQKDQLILFELPQLPTIIEQLNQLSRLVSLSQMLMIVGRRRVERTEYLLRRNEEENGVDLTMLELGNNEVETFLKNWDDLKSKNIR